MARVIGGNSNCAVKCSRPKAARFGKSGGDSECHVDKVQAADI
ncbi:hypothetical protein COLO4_34716 [Corchorus olitorius]|uniref:Uncharacterized protein n=1 Tax=Corchorus olitorius TaxID=93759 RepID=A0A1R3GJS7_9ROSI|nr:hypothetical protein COLO4_34716 [Corchorus olitorius]